MQVNPRFYEMVESLLNLLGAKSKRCTDERGEVYTVANGPLSIDIVGSQEGFINLFALIGEFETLPYEAVVALLLQNNYQNDYPAISTGLLMLEQTARVTLWSRLKLNDATPYAFAELFGRFADTAETIRTWLEKSLNPGQGLPTGTG